MTARELYEYALIELNKLEAPSLLLEDYNYFINKAVQQYINLVYAKLEVDQQSTDDIRVLKASTILKPKKLAVHGNLTDEPAESILSGGMFKSSYYVNLPSDYMHLMNCIVEYTMNACHFKCYNKGEKVYFAARRLTPDMYTQIINNAYLRPMYKRPYYYLNNINTNGELVGSATDSLAQYYHKQNNEIVDWGEDLATSPEADERLMSLANGRIYKLTHEDESFDVKWVDNSRVSRTMVESSTETDADGNHYNITVTVTYKQQPSGLYKEEKHSPLNVTDHAIDETEYKLIEIDAIPDCGSVAANNQFVDSVAPTGDRLSNPSAVRLELRFGNDDGIFVPTALYIDYLKSPMYIRLTQEQINATLDYSQVLEFPDYVCFEIANIFVRLLMENASDPRLQSNIPINKTIPDPMAQAQQAQTRR